MPRPVGVCGFATRQRGTPCDTDRLPAHLQVDLRLAAFLERKNHQPWGQYDRCYRRGV